MNKDIVTAMIENAEQDKIKAVLQTEQIAKKTIAKYEEYLNIMAIENKDLDDEEDEYITSIRTCIDNQDWYKNHDTVFSVFLGLKFCNALSRLPDHVKLRHSLPKLENQIDPWRKGNIQTEYMSRYLDSDWIEIHDDIIICDPYKYISDTHMSTIFHMHKLPMSKIQLPMFYTVLDEQHRILGSILLDDPHIGIVSINDLHHYKAYDELKAKNSDIHSTYIKNFNGRIRFVITPNGDDYDLNIETSGSHILSLNRVITAT